MKLYKKIPLGNNKWYIIKLNDDEARIVGHRFAVSQYFPNDWWREFHTTLEDKVEWLRGLNEYMYEGLFDTALECLYHIELIDANKKLKSIQQTINDTIFDGKLPPFDYFNKNLTEEDPNGIVW